jgi:hypothetical protein
MYAVACSRNGVYAVEQPERPTVTESTVLSARWQSYFDIEPGGRPLIDTLEFRLGVGGSRSANSFGEGVPEKLKGRSRQIAQVKRSPCCCECVFVGLLVE